ncbi:MAG: hypothetical protein PHI99_06500, partial [Syntrophales bacterium]|nr:hypothetical protein [Syntrophales bacterium]
MAAVSICDNRSHEDSFPVDGGNFDKAGGVSGKIKSTLREMGIGNDVVRRAAIITYESEINIVS